MLSKRSNKNKRCYHYKYLKGDEGIFENLVDAVFILLMENSEREKNVMEQLNKYKLHSNIIIQYNKGFKKCSKNLKKQQSNFDLLDANYNIFQKSIEMKYNNILILEDDFIITPNILNKNYIKSIEILINKDDFNLINLGGIYLISKKYDKNIDNPLILSSAHSVIYNKKYFHDFINNYYYKFSQADNFSIVNNKYVTNQPLIVQPFPNTENQNAWPKLGKMFHNFGDKMLDIDWNNSKGKEFFYWQKYYKARLFVELFMLLILLLFSFLIILIIKINKK